MTTQHAPGPWKVWNDHVWTDKPSYKMVDICTLNGNRGDRDSNARLIAAAPELLMYTRQVVDALTHSGLDVDRAISDGSKLIAKIDYGTPYYEKTDLSIVLKERNSL